MNKTCFIPARFLSSRATVATAYRLANLLIVDDDLLAGTKAFLLIWTAFWISFPFWSKSWTLLLNIFSKNSFPFKNHFFVDKLFVRKLPHGSLRVWTSGPNPPLTNIVVRSLPAWRKNQKFCLFWEIPHAMNSGCSKRARLIVKIFQFYDR